MLILAVVASVALPAVAQPRPQTQVRQTFLLVPQGLDVPLVFGQGLSSRTARLGDFVRLYVARDVVVSGVTILRRGTPVTGVISRVDKRKAYGVNASLRLDLRPVRSLQGTMIPLQPRSKGKYVGGGKSDKAAAATAGGAVPLGPVGLIGGSFVKGKPVTIRRGDSLMTEVSTAVRIPVRTTTFHPARPRG